MGNRVWSAVPVIALSMLLAAAAVVIMVGNSRTELPMPAGHTSRQSQASSSTRVVSDAARNRAAALVQPQQKSYSAPSRQVVGAPQSKPVTRPAGKPHSNKPQAQAAAPQKKNAAQADSMANNLGWRLGTEWAVKVRQNASYLANATWISTTYRFKVINADRAKQSFMVSVRFADPSRQPDSAKGDIMRAGYTLRNGAVQLAWVQPQGTGPQLTPAEARLIVGQSFIALELPSSPFTGGDRVGVTAAQLGTVRANRVSLSRGESATFAKGAPWWISYVKGKELKAQLVSFRR